MNADFEEDVIELLKESGFWKNDKAWRYYGDTEYNYSTIGNQQSRPEAALVEKIVNSIDARLMNECYAKGIDPEGERAPQTIRDAVANFFEENPYSYTAGLIAEWGSGKRRDVSRGITVSATGAKPDQGFPSFTISDCGEGQMPRKMPDTLLSIDKKNKQLIPFVQGKFNMGGTGALKFSGYHNLQIVLSRRNPKIVDGDAIDGTDLNWGFTVVRRENPTGGRRSSVYTYLAPIGVGKNPKKGDILNFHSDTMPIFPVARNPYERESQWGTLIKLYEYKVSGFKSDILRSGGLLNRVDLLLPSLALPVRFHECRDYGGHAGSAETTLMGLNVRLKDNKADNIEDDFPITDLMNIGGEHMPVTIYAFKKKRAKTYRKNEGIIFTVNGQTHGYLTKDFFRRQSTKCSYLRDSLLAVVDCGKLTGRAIEDLFMNSRDRLSGDELRIEIEKNLEEIFKRNEILRRLKNKRQQEQRDVKLEDSKPLKTVLETMIKKSPILSQLFLEGTRISNPYRIMEVQEEDKPYDGKKYPTYFKFKGIEYGEILSRSCHINMRCKITFETDVVNDYFGREIDKGEFTLSQLVDGLKIPYTDFTLNMQNGIATLNLKLPSTCSVDDHLEFVAETNDRTQITPFVNEFTLSVLEESYRDPTKKKRRKKPPSKKKGKGREKPMDLDLPGWTEIYEHPEEGQKGWDDIEHDINRYTALIIIEDVGTDEENEDEDEHERYDFYINMDNLYLKSEKKSSKRDPKIMDACFIWGMVLIGIALIHDDIQERKDLEKKEDEETTELKSIHIQDKVENFTKAIAPVLLPMIENLNVFDEDIEFEDFGAGEAA